MKLLYAVAYVVSLAAYATWETGTCLIKFPHPNSVFGTSLEQIDGAEPSISIKRTNRRIGTGQGRILPLRAHIVPFPWL